MYILTRAPLNACDCFCVVKQWWSTISLLSPKQTIYLSPQIIERKRDHDRIWPGAG